MAGTGGTASIALSGIRDYIETARAGCRGIGD
jgi:hypothetical protein